MKMAVLLTPNMHTVILWQIWELYEALGLFLFSKELKHAIK